MIVNLSISEENYEITWKPTEFYYYALKMYI